MKHSSCNTASNTPRVWREQDGVIYFSVTSDGTTGEDWIKRLEEKKFPVSKYAKRMLCSINFKPSNGVTTEVAILKGTLFVNNSERVTKKIQEEARTRNLTTPKPEIACLIREKISDEEVKNMGLFWIVTMHEPIEDSDGGTSLLGSLSYGYRGHFLAFYDRIGLHWDREHGFAFTAS